MARTVQGIAHTWQVGDTPIGSGDAGEVYPVARLDQPDLIGMMKKPARVATAGTIQRQAGQIAVEARALSRLDGLPDSKARPPRLLDQAPEFTQGTANYFIISETAPGEDLASLLTQSRQSGKPFPRRVIMTVLDALFDMFSRAHKAGVLWNDVKLDHIYWHNPSGQVGVIDWGNAFFLDSEAQHGLPRWEDYHQMVDTLGNFLQSSAPELYVDLGWDEFQGQKLDPPRVSILARRIAYQQQVIALQVMEYQSLIRVVLSADPSLEGLQKIAGYKHILEKIGAPWERDDVLKYCQSLVVTALSAGDRQTSVSATTLVWEIFDDALDLPWHLMREYCRQTDILTHAAYPELAKHTLNADWTGALWAASTIASQSPEPVWWLGLIPVMRQQALDTATPPPYQAVQTLLKWADEQHNTNLTHELISIFEKWRRKGEDLKESPLDYELLDIVRENTDLPNRLRSEIKRSFAPGEEAIRGLFKVWTNANWDELPNAFCRMISWDPDRWGILKVSAQVERFRTWLKDLFEGPGIGVNPRLFFTELVENRPRIEHLLGTTPWISTLLNMLSQVNQGTPISSFQAEVNLYCPWLLPYPDLQSADAHPEIQDENLVHAQLLHFASHLKNWSDVDAGLVEIRENAPTLYPLCSKYLDGFRTILSLNANLDALKMITSDAVPPALSEGRQVLSSLITWREQLADQDLAGGMQTLKREKMGAWVLAAHARQVTRDWYNQVLPTLAAIQTFTIPPDTEIRPSDPDLRLLREVSHACADLPALWARIYETGIHAQLLVSLAEGIEAARSKFLDWRVAIESGSDQVVHLVYLSQLEDVRQVSSRLMRMTQHIRQSRLGFATLGEAEQASLGMQITSIENTLDHLASIEAELIPDPDQRRFPGYQNAFKQVAEVKSAESHQALIAALPKDHPFYAWLVKSALA